MGCGHQPYHSFQLRQHTPHCVDAGLPYGQCKMVHLYSNVELAGSIPPCCATNSGIWLNLGFLSGTIEQAQAQAQAER